MPQQTRPPSRATFRRAIRISALSTGSATPAAQRKRLSARDSVQLARELGTEGGLGFGAGDAATGGLLRVLDRTEAEFE